MKAFLFAGAVAATSLFANIAPGEPTTAPSPADTYYQLARDAANADLQALPDITKSASEAADLYIHDNLPIAADGDPAFEWEICGRCGGMMTIQHGSMMKPKQPFKGLVLYALRGPAGAKKDQARLKVLHDDGCKIIVVGPKRWITQSRQAGATFDWIVDNHIDAPDALLDEKGRRVISTSDTANLLAGWTWVGEFVAGCTRLGKMPTMYQGFQFKGGPERDKAIGTAAFHEGTPQPETAGVAGKEYLTSLIASIDALQAEMPKIKAAAAEFAACRAAGHACYCFGDGHAVPQLMPPASHLDRSPYSAQVFSLIGPWGPEKPPKIGPGDCVLGMGYVKVFGDDQEKVADADRKAGAKLVWAVGCLETNAPPPAASGEIVIDEHWTNGDSVVQFPGYDIKVLPPSGVIQTILYNMICAQMLSDAR